MTIDLSNRSISSLNISFRIFILENYKYYKKYKIVMGLFSLFFKKEGDKENQIAKINETLKTSFSNVKKDITNVHKHISDHKEDTHNKFKYIEERIKKLELVLLNNQQNLSKPVAEEVENEEPTADESQLLDLLKGFPRAELRLFSAIYQLQKSLNANHISYKTLAKYLYPQKEYDSIRSTIAQFILRLQAEGLVDKKRMGKEAYVKITNTGHKALRKVRKKNLLRDLEVKN